MQKRFVDVDLFEILIQIYLLLVDLYYRYFLKNIFAFPVKSLLKVYETGVYIASLNIQAYIRPKEPLSQMQVSIYRKFVIFTIVWS